jgi:hypothetical protein
VLSGRCLCDELMTRPEESYQLCCVIVCDLETSRIGAPYIYIYIYDISSLRVNKLLYCVSLKFITNLLTILVNWNFQEILTKDPSSAWGCDTSGNILPCGVALSRTCRCTEFHCVKNTNLRHPSAVR